jgi:hypothetical protein
VVDDDRDRGRGGEGSEVRDDAGLARPHEGRHDAESGGDAVMAVGAGARDQRGGALSADPREQFDDTALLVGGQR